MEAYQAFVHALRSIRRREGWSGEEVSLRMGRNPNYVTSIEHTRRSGYGGAKHGRHRSNGPTLRVVSELARGHRVTLEELGALMDSAMERS